jgi:hypothetical protein
VVFFFLFEFLTPFTLGGCNFFTSIMFLMFFCVLNVLITRVQVLFGQQKQWSLPLGSHLPWTFKCFVIGQFPYNYNSIVIHFSIKKQLKYLTHMLWFQISCYKLYKERLLSYVSTFKYMCHFGMNSKKINLKAKHQNFKNNSWLLFSSFNLMFSYLLTYLGK